MLSSEPDDWNVSIVIHMRRKRTLPESTAPIKSYQSHLYNILKDSDVGTEGVIIPCSINGINSFELERREWMMYWGITLGVGPGALSGAPPGRKSTWIDAAEEEEPEHSNADMVDKSWARGVQMTSKSEDQGRDLVRTER